MRTAHKIDPTEEDASVYKRKYQQITTLITENSINDLNDFYPCVTKLACVNTISFRKLANSTTFQFFKYTFNSLLSKYVNTIQKDASQTC